MRRAVQVVVEIAPEFVVIARTGCVVMAEPRIGDPADVARTVADGVGAATAVLVDAPIGVDGAVGLAGAIAECLRTDGVAVTTAPLDGVLTAARHEPMVRAHEWEPAGRRRPMRVALSAVAASVALLCVGLSVGFDVNGSPAGRCASDTFGRRPSGGEGPGAVGRPAYHVGTGICPS